MMDIIDNRTYSEIRIEALPIGSVFEVEQGLFIKVRGQLQGGLLNRAVCLATGEFGSFDIDDTCKQVNVKLVMVD
jgi:hypothetical protein